MINNLELGQYHTLEYILDTLISIKGFRRISEDREINYFIEIKKEGNIYTFVYDHYDTLSEYYILNKVISPEGFIVRHRNKIFKYEED